MRPKRLIDSQRLSWKMQHFLAKAPHKKGGSRRPKSLCLIIIKELRGPISRDIAIVSLRYPYRAILSQPSQQSPKRVRYPLGTSFTQTYQCDTPILQHIARDTCAIPRKTSTKTFCDTIAQSIARYEKYRYWAS